MKNKLTESIMFNLNESRKIEKEIFTFDELNDDAKKKAIKYFLANEEYPFLEDEMGEEAERLLEENFPGATLNGTNYSLSYSQGDGAMIEFEFPIKAFNDKYKVLSNDEVTRLENSVGDIAVVHNGGFYYHEYAFKIVFETYNNYAEDIEDKFYDALTKGDKLNNPTQFEADIIKMNEELARFGYETLEYYNSDENVADILRVNEYEFYEDGSMY